MINKDLELRIQKKILDTELEIKFHPSDFEDLDYYSANNEEFEVNSLGKTEEESIKNAEIFLREFFINNIHLLR